MPLFIKLIIWIEPTEDLTVKYVKIIGKVPFWKKYRFIEYLFTNKDNSFSIPNTV